MYKVLIRPLREEDALVSWKWRNDDEVWQFTGNRPDRFITEEIELEWIKKAIADTSSQRFAILVDDVYVGNIQLTNIKNGLEAEYHIFIGDKSYWGKGVARLATAQILHYAKEILGLKRVYLSVAPSNIGAIKSYEKSGFIKKTNAILMEVELEQVQPPMVSVFMMSYNHEAYISQALEGILMQKCDFDFIIVIGDDYSKDSTREIILQYARLYPGKFKLLFHKENVGAPRNQETVFNNCNGKYVAMCEGDDYWTDHSKLQKQVDFLEKNLEYSACSHQSEVIYEGSNKPSHLFRTGVNKVLTLKDLLNGRSFHTASLLFRAEIIGNNPIPTEITSGDRALNFLIASYGKIYFMNDIMCTYRKNEGGISSWVTSSLLKKDLNIIPWIYRINKDFPRYRYKSFIYKTAFTYPPKLSLNEVVFCYTLYVIYSFSFFPKNLKDIIQTSIKKLPKALSACRR